MTSILMLKKECTNLNILDQEVGDKVVDIIVKLNTQVTTTIKATTLKKRKSTISLLPILNPVNN